MSRKTYRKGIDPGYESVRPWIDQWYGDSSELDIEIVTISIPHVGAESDIARTDKYRKAFRGNETPLHGVLKYAAYEWLSTNCSEEPVYEQKIYTPIDELTSLVTHIGTFDPTVPQLIEKGRIDVWAGDGLVIMADVYCERCSVEVGYTQPFNLFTPMLDDLTDMAVWVPFPKGIKPNDYDPFSNLLKSVNAYKFAFKEGA